MPRCVSRRAAIAATLTVLVAALPGCAGPGDQMSALGYRREELCFERNGMRIYGELFRPRGFEAGETPLVVISHGFCSSYHDTARDAQRLAAVGIACYVFDFCGGSPGSSSQGDFLDMSVLTEEADLEAVMGGLREQGLIGEKNLFLMGESQGGMVSALVAARRPEDVAGLVLFYPAFSIPDDARERFASKEEIPETAEGLFGTTVGRCYYADILDLYPLDLIGAYEGPVRIYHGDADNVVLLSYSERAAEVYGDAQLTVVAGAGHGFTDEQLDDVCAEVADFIEGVAARASVR